MIEDPTMFKRLSMLSAVAMMAGSVSVAAFAQDTMQKPASSMSHDSMSHDKMSAPHSSMAHDKMSSGAMTHGAMAHDAMAHDSMSHDKMAAPADPK